MNHKENWLAASVFFLSGSILFSASSLVRGQLYAAMITQPSWEYPDSLIESMVPGYLQNTATVAFTLSAISIVFPYVVKLWVAQSKFRQE